MEIQNYKNSSAESAARTKGAGSAAVKESAAKIGKIVQLPVTKMTRQARLLRDTRDLSKKLQKNWDGLKPTQLARLSTDLLNKVALLKGPSAQINKIREASERLVFQCRFPIVLELSSTSGANMPFSFARVVNQVAKQMLTKQSLEPIKQLNDAQINEVMRCAKGEV